MDDNIKKWAVICDLPEGYPKMACGLAVVAADDEVQAVKIAKGVAKVCDFTPTDMGLCVCGRYLPPCQGDDHVQLISDNIYIANDGAKNG